MCTTSHSKKKHLKKDVTEAVVYRGIIAKQTPDDVVDEFRRVAHLASVRTS